MGVKSCAKREYRDQVRCDTTVRPDNNSGAFYYYYYHYCANRTDYEKRNWPKLSPSPTLACL